MVTVLSAELVNSPTKESRLPADNNPFRKHTIVIPLDIALVQQYPPTDPQPTHAVF